MIAELSANANALAAGTPPVAGGAEVSASSAPGGARNDALMATRPVAGELLLLAVSLLWVLLRLLSIISGKIKEGKSVHIKVFGHHLVEVKAENLNSVLKLTEKNI
jgi:hypothetical protein